jgi:RNA polymerase sigma factor (sigma-70 family)
MNSNNPAPLTAERDWEQYRPLIETQARKYVKYGISLEDLVQEGYIGLLEAAARFDPAQNASFETYAAFWIRKHLLQAVDKELKHTQIVKSDESAVPVAPSRLATDECNSQLNLPDSMPNLEKQVLKLSYGENLTINEIGTELGLTSEKVLRIRSKALRRLRGLNQAF